MRKPIEDFRAYENPPATSETVAQSEAILTAHGIGSLEKTRKGQPTSPSVIRAILRDVRKANAEAEQ